MREGVKRLLGLVGVAGVAVVRGPAVEPARRSGRRGRSAGAAGAAAAATVAIVVIVGIVVALADDVRRQVGPVVPRRQAIAGRRVRLPGLADVTGVVTQRVQVRVRGGDERFSLSLF